MGLPIGDFKRPTRYRVVVLTSFPMLQTNHFFNLGYGWLCKHCSSADTEAKHRHSEASVGQQQKAPGLALAGWTDASRQALTCPRCGIEETITNA